MHLECFNEITIHSISKRLGNVDVGAFLQLVRRAPPQKRNRRRNKKKAQRERESLLYV